MSIGRPKVRQKLTIGFWCKKFGLWCLRSYRSKCFSLNTPRLLSDWPLVCSFFSQRTSTPVHNDSHSSGL